MESHVVKILSSEFITHNVKRIRVEKPANYSFVPGQATEVSINLPGWEDKRRPFTFTSLNEWAFLEFTIKMYRDIHGVTEQLEKLQAGDELILHDVFGAISYQGPGVFIAGGAGVTPFIAIFRQLQKEGRLTGNSLICSNRTPDDIILKDELDNMLGINFHNVLTRDHVIGFTSHAGMRINQEYLINTIRNFSQHFYVCGPDQFVVDITRMLLDIGAKSESLILEK
jgi:ferredoxin-NADP reductase